MTSRDSLVFRQDYFDDPAGWAAIKDLLIDIFEVDVSPLDRLGGHDRTNMASAFFDADGRCVANFSAFSMPLVVKGLAVRAAGLQSGAVRPEWRGQGLFRSLIGTTLARCDAAGFEALLLYTDKPGLYEPYGFSTIAQFSFAGAARERQMPLAGASRRLDIADPTDLALVRQALATRMPVSDLFAVRDQSLMFLLNCHLIDGVRIDLIEGAVVASRIAADGAFELLDIAGPHIPTLGQILGTLGRPAERVRILFPPDRLDCTFEPVEDTGALKFMMRAGGEFIPDAQFCLSPMAEF